MTCCHNNSKVLLHFDHWLKWTMRSIEWVPSNMTKSVENGSKFVSCIISHAAQQQPLLNGNEIDLNVLKWKVSGDSMLYEQKHNRITYRLLQLCYQCKFSLQYWVAKPTLKFWTVQFWYYLPNRFVNSEIAFYEFWITATK